MHAKCTYITSTFVILYPVIYDRVVCWADGLYSALLPMLTYKNMSGSQRLTIGIRFSARFTIFSNEREEKKTNMCKTHVIYSDSCSSLNKQYFIDRWFDHSIIHIAQICIKIDVPMRNW